MSDWKKHHEAGYKAADSFLFKNFKKAEEEFKKAIAIAEKENKNNLASSLNCLAVVYRAQNKKSEAIEAYKRTIEAEPDTVDMADACMALGDMLLEEGNEEQALEYYVLTMRAYTKRGLLTRWAEEQEKVLSIMLATSKFQHLHERELNDGERAFIQENSRDCYDNLSLPPDATPTIVLENIDKRIDWLQEASEEECKGLDQEKTLLGLSTLWGEQLVKEFGWSWVCFEGAGDMLAVVSGNRSFVVTPIHFVRACMEDPQLDCTIMLSFNMVKNAPPENFPANDYNNLMEAAFRIVPKEGRTRSYAEGRLPS
ncbi:MAG: tetratricopeptide repeat protein [Cyanobacteria bacterium]|nr:tetratricopeptide repeat protein [Cyanobacteriota bacterium]